MKSKYDKLVAKIKDLQSSKRDFIEQFRQDERTLTELQEKYELAITSGQEITEISKKIDELESKTTKDRPVVEKHYQNDNTKAQNQAYKYNPGVNKLSREIIVENSKIAMDQQRKHAKLVNELAEIKNKLMLKIQEIGQVVKENDKVVSQVRYANEYVENAKNPYQLKIDERIIAGKGIIYIAQKECDLAYQGKYEGLKNKQYIL